MELAKLGTRTRNLLPLCLKKKSKTYGRRQPYVIASSVVLAMVDLEKLESKISTIIIVSLLCVMLVFVFLTAARDIYNYKHPETNLTDAQVGHYVTITGTVKSFSMETTEARTHCGRSGCYTNYYKIYTYIVLAQNRNVRVYFQEPQVINSTITFEAKVYPDYLEAYNS